MKFAIGPALLGTAVAAAVVRSAACVPGLVASGPETNNYDEMIEFRPTCGAKLDGSGACAVFAALNTTTDADTYKRGRRSMAGVYVPGAECDEEAVRISKDLLAGVGSVIVSATSAAGEPLLGAFDLSSPATSQEGLRRAAISKDIPEERDANATCSACTSPAVLCQPSCQTPPQTCAFYRTCAEAALPCGASGYALGYGQANCDRFLRRLSHFSQQGQAWIFRVMTCLQRFLIDGPLLRCGLTCDALKEDAFSSHPGCYLDSGVCALPVWDWVQLVVTIREDLLTLDTLRQAVTTGGACLGRYVQEIGEEIERLWGELEDGGDRAVVLGEIGVLEAVKKIFE